MWGRPSLSSETWSACYQPVQCACIICRRQLGNYKNLIVTQYMLATGFYLDVLYGGIETLLLCTGYKLHLR